MRTNHIVMARHPCDMRMGVNAMCGRVHIVGLNPACGDVYIFCGQESQGHEGVALGARRLHDVLQTSGAMSFS